MGSVYRARDLRLDRVVAIKFLSEFSDSQISQRFGDEAKAAAQLQHPNIVQVFESRIESEHPHFVMEFVAGATLQQAANGRPLPPSSAASVVSIIAKGVEFAHGKGIIHRDLKPGNVLIPFREDAIGRATNGALHSFDELDIKSLKIADFGLARFINNESKMTKTGEILGTPEYMAPEQASGLINRISAQTDVYACGAILYELLTGRPPFLGADPVQILMAILSDEPIAPRSVVPKTPRDLETICLKCLEKKPNRRYSSARELSEDLDRYLRGEPIKARPISAAQRLWKWSVRKPWQAVAIGSFSVFVLSLVASVFLLRSANDVIQKKNSELTESNKRLSIATAEADRAFQISQNGLSGIVEDVRNGLYDLPQTEKLMKQVDLEALELSRRLYELRPKDLFTAKQYAQMLFYHRDAEWLAGRRDSSWKVQQDLDALLAKARINFPNEQHFSILQFESWMDQLDDQETIARLSADEFAAIEKQVNTRFQELLQAPKEDPKIHKIAARYSRRQLTIAVAAKDLKPILQHATDYVTHLRKFYETTETLDKPDAETRLIDGLLNLASYQILAKDWDGARTSLNEAEAMLNIHPNTLKLTRNDRELRGTLLIRRASLAFASNDEENVLVLLRAAAHHNNKLAEDFGKDQNRRGTSIELSLKLASVLAQRSELEEAKRNLDAANNEIESLLKEFPGEWLYENYQAQAKQLAKSIAELETEPK